MNATTTETLRLFFALWPNDATRTAMMGLQEPMRGRRIPYANLHLTLAFLGHQPVSLVPDIKEILKRLKSPAIPITLDRVGYFSRNRIAWVGTHAVPNGLVALYRELADALEHRGIAFNRQHDFQPHITLAREVLLLPDMVFEPIVWRADRVALVQSTTLAEGSSYKVIAARSLDEVWQAPDEAAGDDMTTHFK